MTLLITAREILAAVRRRPKGYGVTSRRLQHSPAKAGQNVYTLLRRPFGPMQREGAKATERGEAELLAQLLPFFQARTVTAAERRGGVPAVTPSLA